MSKHQLLEHWPQPKFIRDVAKIIKFAQSYSKFIPQFELQIAPLCDLITNLEYQAGCATLDDCRSRVLRRHKTGNIIRSVPEAF
jgi:hypothetical protein